MRQVPAGSLPNNSRILASLAGYANAPRRWGRIREMALYGWLPCSDGRLYHPVLAELVLDIQESMTAKKNRVEVLSPMEERKRKTRERVRKWRLAQTEKAETEVSSPGQRASIASSGVTPQSVTGSVTVTHIKEEEEIKNREKEKSNTQCNAESVTDGVTRSVTKDVTKSVTDCVTRDVTNSVTREFLQKNNAVPVHVGFPDQDGIVADWSTSESVLEWECTSLVEPIDFGNHGDDFFEENIFLNLDAPVSGAERKAGDSAVEPPTVAGDPPTEPMTIAESDAPSEVVTQEMKLSRTMAILFPDTVEEAEESAPVVTLEAEPVTEVAIMASPAPQGESDTASACEAAAEAAADVRTEPEIEVAPVQEAECEAAPEESAEPEPSLLSAEGRSQVGDATPTSSEEDATQTPSAAPSRFEEFWSAYPNKVGKKPCMKKWKVRKLDRKADEIIAHVKRSLVLDTRWLRDFIPNPLTYLNQNRWEDEIKIQRTPQPDGTRVPYASVDTQDRDALPKNVAGLELVNPGAATPVLQVFNHWCRIMQQDRAVLDDRRHQVIVRTLETHGLQQCLDAIDGCAASPFHMGDNDKDTPFNDLSLIFRDADHVEKFIGIKLRSQKASAGVAGIMGEEAAQWCRANLSKPGQRTADNLANWMAMNTGSEGNS